MQEARASHDNENTATVGQQPEDDANGSRTLAQQLETAQQQEEEEEEERRDPPLEGYSLLILGPDNPFRKKINRVLNQP